MSEARPPEQNTSAEAPQPQETAVRKPSMFDDPVVRRMIYASVFLVILFLSAVLGVLGFGMLQPSGPRTVQERDLMVTAALVQAGSTNPDDWSAYATALINAGQYGRANRVIADARRSVDDSGTASIAVAEVRLLKARNDSGKADEVAIDAMAQIEAHLDERIATGGEVTRVALLDGLPETYYILALLRAEMYTQAGEWVKAIEMYDLYIEKNKAAADILIDRAIAKTETGDIAGAEEDLNTALKFDPTNAQGLAALEKIGATNE